MKLGMMQLPDQANLTQMGVAEWRNPINGFKIIALHYTADPKKATAEWKEKTKQDYTDKDWDQELEIDFSSWVGRPVYTTFSKIFHVSKEPLSWTPKRHMWRGWDIGIHACVWAQLAAGQLYLFCCRQTAGAFGPNEVRYQNQELTCSGLGQFIQEC